MSNSSISININFDSMGWALGYPSDYEDKTFTTIGDRFMRLAEKYNFKYTIFVIGKDLENGRNAEAVCEWSRRGHEIGNHSYHHQLDFGTLNEKETYREVEKTHELIFKACGKEPKGFIAPNWASSKYLTKVLIDLDYVYDTSHFPSWLLYLLVLKNFLNHLGSDRIFSTIRGQDYLIPLIGHRQIFEARYKDKMIKVLPLPTNRFRIACWHTFGFYCGWKLQEIIIKSSINTTKAFYYLMHPADLIGAEDVENSTKLYFARMKHKSIEKYHYLDNMLNIISSSNKSIVTLLEHCEKIKQDPTF